MSANGGQTLVAGQAGPASLRHMKIAFMNKNDYYLCSWGEADFFPFHFQEPLSWRNLKSVH
jgi:hypothetical protein